MSRWFNTGSAPKHSFLSTVGAVRLTEIRDKSAETLMASSQNHKRHVFPQELIDLVDRYRKEHSIEVCGQIGRVISEYLESIRDGKATSTYGEQAVSRLVQWLENEDSYLPESTIYDCMRLRQRCIEFRIPGLSNLTITAAFKLASVENDRIRVRLAKKAIAKNWTARQVSRAVLEVRGFRRRLSEPGSGTPNKSERPRKEKRHAWQPARHPRVGLRELARLTRRAARAAAGWIDPPNDETQIIDEFRKLYLTSNNGETSSVLTRNDADRLEAIMKSFLDIAQKLEKQLTQIDLQLAVSERPSTPHK